MGMGGAVTACLFDASNNYWNPGTISRINGNQFHITGAEWLVDTRWNLISGISDAKRKVPVPDALTISTFKPFSFSSNAFGCCSFTRCFLSF